MKMYHSYDNEQLLQLVAKEDERAFTTIYERYWHKLYSIAYNRLKNEQEAEDIVHDVFVSLWHNRHKNQIESLENYLATATKYLVFAILRKKEKDRQYAAVHKASGIIEMSVEASLHYKRILEIIQEETEKLPEKCKLIFKYSREKGMPVKQIAKELNLSPKTVENQLTKALRQLKLAARSFLNFL